MAGSHTANVGELVVEQAGVGFDGLGKFALAARSFHARGFVVADAWSPEWMKVSMSARGTSSCDTAAVSKVCSAFSSPWRLFFFLSDWFGARIDGRVEVVDEAFLTHVVDDFARGVERAFDLRSFTSSRFSKDLAEHFRVNGHFLFQRLGFVDGEVVAVEHVEDARAGVAGLVGLGIGEKRVGDDDVGLLPVVIRRAVQRVRR